jgi:Tfp pilus assembly protein PilO
MGKEVKLIIIIIAVAAVVVYGYNAWMNSATTTS